jgi:hypothetical protein
MVGVEVALVTVKLGLQALGAAAPVGGVAKVLLATLLVPGVEP